MNFSSEVKKRMVSTPKKNFVTKINLELPGKVVLGRKETQTTSNSFNSESSVQEV